MNNEHYVLEKVTFVWLLSTCTSELRIFTFHSSVSVSHAGRAPFQLGRQEKFLDREEICQDWHEIAPS